MGQADCPLNICLIVSDPLVSKDNKGKSTMTTSHRRILQKIDTPKTHVQNVIHLYHEKKKKLSKNKTITKNNNKNIIAVRTVLKDNQ